MTPNSPRSPSQLSSYRQGFQPLSGNNQSTENMGSPNYTTTDIPLQNVVSHTPSHAPTVKDEHNEKGGLFNKGGFRGRRRLQKVNSKTGDREPHPDVQAAEEEKTALNRMGRIYTKILNFSVVTRYMIYVAPLAIALAIPIIIGKTVAKNATIGHEKEVNGQTIQPVGLDTFFIWLETVWLSLWAAKIVVHFLPPIFEFLVGVVSPGIRKYVLLLAAIEIPLSIVVWGIVSQVTFPLIIRHQNETKDWRDIMQRILLAALISSCVVLAERILIQLISISYHRKQFDAKIKESKRNIYLLGLLYDASRTLFPAYCNEFAEEDYIIQDNLNIALGLGSKKGTYGNRARSGSHTPMRLLQNVGRVGDKVTSVFGTVAHEITGKKVFDPNSAHSIVLEALENNKSAEALARRLWLSFVVEGNDALYQEDLVEVMGDGREKEAEECFSSIDKDGNGDISLEEMILTVTEYGRERKAIATSMHDVDQAINALDALLFTIVFIVCVFIFVAFLVQSFVTTLTTSATALLSLSFVFAATCQEVLGSCIFLFVKHPYDIGDRVDITSEQLTVEHISLLYTVFKRVTNGKTVQIPNIVLNNLWVENVSRSKAMREQVSIYVNFDTTFQDINYLKQELITFVRDPQNSRDYQPDIEIEVISVAEMNKLELRAEIRHKSNWNNEALRASRRSKFMCALVLALRKIPIYAPGGGDEALGGAGKPSWSVAISPEAAIAAREKFNADKEAKRFDSTKKPDNNQDQGKSSGVDYLAPGQSESKAVGFINNRAPGADPLRDDTWNARDDISTLGRPSTDANVEEVRGLLQKQSSRGKRRQGDTARPSMDTPRSDMPAMPSSGAAYAPPPSRGTAPVSPSSVSTGRIEEFQYQQMMPPPRSQGRDNGNASIPNVQQAQSGTQSRTSPNPNNPYRSPSLQERHPYRP